MKEVDIPRNRSGIIHLDTQKYEDKLKVSICVISHRLGDKKVYPGTNKYSDRIFLYHTSNGNVGHFDVITRVNALLNTSYYCDICDKGFNNRDTHSCISWCKVCGSSDCKQTQNTVQCSDCNRVCRSNTCYEEHKLENKIKKGKNKGESLPSQCSKSWKCPDCGIILKTSQRTSKEHECGETQCSVCFEYYIGDHLCYMRAVSSSNSPQRFIFYDFECTQDEGEHIPNYVVAHSICPDCEDNPVTPKATCDSCGHRCFLCNELDSKTGKFVRDPCKNCGKREVVFSGKHTAGDFCRWLIDDQHKYVTAIAHNARAYDAMGVNSCI